MDLRKGDLVFLSILVGITIFLHLYDFYLPPLWPDEISSYIAALPMAYPSNSDLYDYGMSWGYQHIGPFPTQFAPYIGLIESYPIVPFVHFLGFNIVSIRSYEMFVAIMILVCTYFAGKELFSRRVGIVTSSLLSVLPMFVFYSRQSATYDWLLIVFSLLIIIFGFRYLKTGKIRYLFGSLVPIGLGVWGYSWFIWFVLGLLFIIPLLIKHMIKNTNTVYSNATVLQGSLSSLYYRHKIKFIILSLIFLIIGSSPLILQQFLHPNESLFSFIVSTVQNTNNGYAGASQNSDFIGNLVMRGHHFFDILGNSLSVGLRYASLHDPVIQTSYVFPLLFSLSITISIIYVIYRRKNFKRILGLLLLISVIMITSCFTTSSFNQNQLGLVLPLIFLLIGRSIEIITTSATQLHIFSFLKNNSNYVIFSVVAVLIFSQIPILVQGYELLETSPTAFSYVSYEQLNNFIKANNLTPISTDWSVIRLLTPYTNGEQILHSSGVSFSPYMEFGPKEKESMTKLESLNLLNEKYLFVTNIYPIAPQCSKYPLNQAYQDQYRCAQIYFIQSAADRNNKHVKIVDFPLPDGTPFLRAYRFVN